MGNRAMITIIVTITINVIITINIIIIINIIINNIVTKTMIIAIRMVRF